MTRLHRQPICVASALLVPFLQLSAPAWMNLDGVPPSWAILWLLPWSLVDGPLAGAISGAAIGLVLDGLSLGEVTQVPALVLMGWWWGRLGRRGPPIQRSLNLGLLAWIGSLIMGLSLWIQWLLLGASEALIQSWALQTTLAQALITGVLAPLVGSWQLLLWRRRAPA